MERVGIRELRNDVAAVVRRAGAGERVVVTIDGRPAAQLGPLESDGAPTIDDLAAAGLVHLPGRGSRPEVPEPVALPIDVEPEGVLASLRGDDPRR